MSVALKELEEGVRDLTTGGSAADTEGGFRAAAKQLLSGHKATINKLLNGLDEVSVGEIADAAAMAAARTRKKAAAATLEGALLPKAAAIQAKLEPPTPAAPPPIATSAAETTFQSAEIDSDED